MWGSKGEEADVKREVERKRRESNERQRLLQDYEAGTLGMLSVEEGALGRPGA